MRYKISNILSWIFRYLFLTIWAVIILVPIVWIFLSAFKPANEVLQFSLPSRIELSNFTIPYSTRPYFKYYLNSVIFSSISTISVLFFSSLAGYGFSKFRFFGRKFLFIMVMGTLMISVHVTMVPLFNFIYNLDLVDTMAGLLAPFMITGFGVFLMRQFIYTIPDELINAARVDGASEISIYFKIILPLSMPIIAALGVINFIACWDEFLWPLVIGLSKTRTMTVGLSLFITGFASPFNQLFAVSVTAIGPILLAYFFAQKHFVKSLALTGLKE